MYNYHKFLEEKQKHKAEVHSINEHINRAIARNKLKQESAQKYHKRLQKFIRSVVNNPIVVNKDQPSKRWVLRQYQPHKILKDAQIYINSFKTETQRVNQVIKANSLVDTVPSRSVSLHQFRSRDISKQIQHDMKFTCNTGVQRVQEHLINVTMPTDLNESIVSSNKNEIKDKTKGLSRFEKISYLSREISKNLLSSLHQKTHFKGLQQLSNRLPKLNSLQNLTRRKDIKSEQIKTNPQMESPRSQIRTELNTTAKRNTKSKIDPIQASKIALLNCKIIKQKNPHIKMLRKGQGKNFFTS